VRDAIHVGSHSNKREKRNPTSGGTLAAHWLIFDTLTRQIKCQIEFDSFWDLLGRGWSKEKKEGDRSGTKNLFPHNTDISSSLYIYGYTRRKRSGKKETSRRGGIPLKERQVNRMRFSTRGNKWKRCNFSQYSAAVCKLLCAKKEGSEWCRILTKLQMSHKDLIFKHGDDYGIWKLRAMGHLATKDLFGVDLEIDDWVKKNPSILKECARNEVMEKYKESQEKGLLILYSLLNIPVIKKLGKVITAQEAFTKLREIYEKQGEVEVIVLIVWSVRDVRGGNIQKTIVLLSVMDMEKLDMWQPTVLEKISPRRRRKEKYLPN
jgi:hypothetical protein